MPFTVAALELTGRGGTPAERLARADIAVAEATAQGATLVLLPEAYLPGYPVIGEDEEKAGDPRADGHRAREWMARVARRHTITVVMGYVEAQICLLGVTTPDGAHVTYAKRFLSPREARVWRPGAGPVLVDTPAGRVGLLVCADVLHLAAWAPLRGAVDAVLVAAAWPDYRGRLERTPRAVRPLLAPLLKPLFAASNPYRQDLLARAARATGAPVVFANACGPFDGAEHFSGGTCVYDADGTIVATGRVAVASVGRGRPGTPLTHPLPWHAFSWAYRRTSALRSTRRAIPHFLG